MTRRGFRISRELLRALSPALLLALFLMVAALGAGAEAGPYERTYPQPKSAVEKALKELQSALSGHLPALEGFALPGDHPLNRYQRAFYQSAVQVSTNASGGSMVRVSTKVTAWYADSTPSHSGYQLLTSNGRLETDLLDELTDLLASGPGATRPDTSSKGGGSNGVGSNGGTSQSSGENSGSGFPRDAATISAPTPQFAQAGSAFSSSTTQQGLSARQLAETKNSADKTADRSSTDLQAEAASLEEVLKNQAHPRNLVAIKKSGTPVVATPSLNGKTLFLATAHDEFEMLDFNADWVHVRISGLSRGWIWRTGLEMPEGISDIPLVSAKAVPVAADLFQVSREEAAPFPGDWEPLRGKNVKIVSVQKIQENEKNSGADAKLEFAKSLLDQNYAELARSHELFGIVLIFDSVDGGMIAATLPTVQQWKAGRLTDAALWHQCYFDPPETFTVSSGSEGH